MRFLKALTRYKILKTSDQAEILLQNYTAAQKEKLKIKRKFANLKDKAL